MPWLTIKKIDAQGREVSRGPGGLPVAFAFNLAGEKWLRRYVGKDVEVQIIGHSEEEHRTFFGYCQWVWSARYRESHPSFDVWREWLSIACGHTESRAHDIPDGNGGTVRVMTFKALSWGMKCSHDVFHPFTRRAEEFLFKQTGLSIRAYLDNLADAEEEANERP